jgi:hypothetical protein
MMGLMKTMLMLLIRVWRASSFRICSNELAASIAKEYRKARGSR